MKNTADRESLLDDVLGDPADLRATSLEFGLDALRHARSARRRRPIWLACTALLLALTFLAARLDSEGGDWDRPARASHLAAAAPAAKPGAIQLISEDELLEQFPDRAVAIVGPPEHRQLVFLDAPPTAAMARASN